jgi:SAM-dependent methyltransferase
VSGNMSEEQAPAAEGTAMVGATAFDVSKPNIARVYDYWLGGKDNYAADRAEAERLLGIYPRLPQLARENRLFLARAVTWLAARGISQFLDIGSGLPTAQNTHEVAQAVDPACRVVYADNDPVVAAHARALLSDSGVEATCADLADPAGIAADPVVARRIRPAEPTGLILGMVLHFFDTEAAAKITAALADWLAPGSYLVVSVGSGDERTGGALAREYRAATLHNHTPQQVAGFFAYLDLVPPGLVDARDWSPGTIAAPPAVHRGGRILAGAGRKPYPAADTGSRI